MLQIRNLTITHLKDLKELVKDLSLTVNQGDKVAIIGEEGNGKSTLLKLLLDERLVSSYVSYSGQIDKSYTVAVYLPQQLPSEDAQLTLNDYFFADFETELDYAKLYRYAGELNFDSQRFASQQQLSSLSGGEKLKVQLIKKLGYKEAGDFYTDIAEDKIDLNASLATYVELQKREAGVAERAEVRSAETFSFSDAAPTVDAGQEDVLVIDNSNLKGVQFQMARCCHPVYGDEVFGFVTVSGGIKIHRDSCPNARAMRERFPYRVVRSYSWYYYPKNRWWGNQTRRDIPLCRFQSRTYEILRIRA